MLLLWTKIGVEFFLFAQFFPKAHQAAAQQLVDLRKVRAEKLKFRKHLRDQVMDGWSVTQ